MLRHLTSNWLCFEFVVAELRSETLSGASQPRTHRRMRDMQNPRDLFTFEIVEVKQHGDFTKGLREHGKRAPDVYIRSRIGDKSLLVRELVRAGVRAPCARGLACDDPVHPRIEGLGGAKSRDF